MYLCRMNRESGIVAFSGHRNYDDSGGDALREAIASLYAAGAREFRVGMAEGFDLAAAEAVLEFKRGHGDVRLVAIVPWPLFFANFKRSNELRYFKILAAASVIRYVAAVYIDNIFLKRNDMLIDGADYLVAWWHGRPSGTGYTVRQARRQKIEIINLYDKRQLTLDFNG